MTDSVPVSPAAQAVETPELWWDAHRRRVIARDSSRPQDGQVFGWYRDHGTLLNDVPADAVRLVPAPGPDTSREADLLRSLDHLVGSWSSGRTYSPSARPEDDLRSALARHRGGQPLTVGVTHRFPESWSWDGDFDHHPDQPRFTCCGRRCSEVGEHDHMAFSDDLVTCAGVRTDGETPQ